MSPLLLTALFLLLPEAVLAQVISVPVRTVSGTVTDSIDGRTLRGVDLHFDRSDLRTETRSGGLFSLQDVGPADTVLVVRLVGYVPRRIIVPYSLSAALVSLDTVRLRPVATQLDRIEVEAEEVRTYPHLADFYRRKQEGLAGTFFTREDIAKTATRKTSEMMRRTTKVSLSCPNNPGAASRQGAGAGGLPGGGAGTGCSALNRRDLKYCPMDIFVDGRATQMDVDEIELSDIAAIEVYAGVATTPANFGHRPCGVIAIWLVRDVAP